MIRYSGGVVFDPQCNLCWAAQEVGGFDPRFGYTVWTHVESGGVVIIPSTTPKDHLSFNCGAAVSTRKVWRSSEGKGGLSLVDLGSFKGIYHCRGPGCQVAGTVWGSPEAFTNDSCMCIAGQVAGVCDRRAGGFEGFWLVFATPGLQEYPSVTANSVTTNAYGAWSGSLKFLQITEENAAAIVHEYFGDEDLASQLDSWYGTNQKEKMNVRASSNKVVENGDGDVMEVEIE
eukprot:TRINITY_DN195_c1_g1_i4.p1 TRINITY_DN195_c1_g1~~TRINITY_DN195_c1_g1_i4.p1  ORF type:complete len:231 (-),score=49.05 TRINITY_DN195_c1_g1_i4:315-1007(-)